MSDRLILENATDLDCIRWYVECLDAVAFKRRAVAGLAEAEGSYNAAMKHLTDRDTRPAEPAALTVDTIAAFLHKEVEWPEDNYPAYAWPEVDGDTGQRDGGYVKIVPKYVVEEFRGIARRLLIAFRQEGVVPTEPAARVAEAGDGEVVAWIEPDDLSALLSLAGGGVSGARHVRGLRGPEWQVGLVRLSTLEAERARADELRRLLTASGRCVDDLTARLANAEHVTQVARNEATRVARDYGFDHALAVLEHAPGSPTYYAADGSETWEGDTRGTIYNLLRASGVWRGDDDMLVTRDRDFWKERFQVESRSRIEAEQRAADALARAEKAEGALAEAQGALVDLADWLENDCGAELPHSHIEKQVALARSDARASREAQAATDGGEADV